MSNPLLPLEKIIEGQKNDCWQLIHENLQKITKENEYFRHFFWSLQKHSAIQKNIALYGGACRDFLYGFTPKDLDFVYVNSSGRPNEEILKEVLRFAFQKFLPDNKIKFNRNKYGSIVLDLNGLIIDLWEIKDTWIFNQNGNENLTKDFRSLNIFSPLSSDMIFYLFSGNMMVDSFFKKSLEYKILYSQSMKVVDKKYHAMRMMKIAHKYSWELSSLLQQYVQDQLGINPAKYDWEEDEFLILSPKKLSSNQSKKTNWRKIIEMRKIDSSNSNQVLKQIDVMKYLGLKNPIYEDDFDFDGEDGPLF